MNVRWAWSLPVTECRLLGPLRLWPGVEVCEVSAAVWLRAAQLDVEQWERCRRLPGADRYTVLDDGQLLPVDHLAPRGYLPAGPWQPLAKWLDVALPAADTSCPAPQGVELRLVRSNEPCDPTWLLATLEAWVAYAVTAPQVRLARWSFAADRQGGILVRGAPLPPLPGTRCVESHGIVVPAGWTWSPRVDAMVLRDTFELGQGDSAFWQVDGSWQRILAGDWVRATRSAVRLTCAELQRGC